MEGSNGNGKPGGGAEEPGRAEEAPPGGAQQATIAISTEIQRRALQTTAERGKDGTLAIEFVVRVGGEYEIHRYVIGEQGKKSILDAATGGIHMPGDVSPADLKPGGGS